MTRKVVYDTNVIVSAALKPGSIPASLVALAMERQVRLFLSQAILDEYTDVLNRPKFRLDPQDVARFLQDLAHAATMVVPTRRLAVALDEPDNRFLECAKKTKAHYLVTGNKRHFPFADFQGTAIVNPAEFVRSITE